ncbi:MAG TPA: hypothetical protein VGD21_12970 [Lysobacter sp.]
MADDRNLNERELTGDDALRFARESGMEGIPGRASFIAGVGDLIRFARLVRAGWTPPRGVRVDDKPVTGAEHG